MLSIRKPNNSGFQIRILNITYYILLCISYKNNTDAFGYAGNIYNPNSFKFIIGIFLIVLSSEAIIKTTLRTKIYLWLFHILIVIPTSAVYYISDYNSTIALSTTLASLLLPFLCYQLRRVRFKTNNTFFSALNISNIIYILTFIYAIYFVLTILERGFSNLNFDLSRIYEFREHNSKDLSTIYQYIESNTTKCILPGITILFAAKKNWKALAILQCTTILLFGIHNHKIVALICPVTLILYQLIISKNFERNTLFIFNVGVGLVTVTYELTDSFEVQAILDRAIFMYGWLNFKYYEFYSINDFVYWSNSKLTLGLIKYPYGELTPYEVIGSYLTDGLLVHSANTGYIGSAYMNAGVFGIAIETIAFAFIISLIEKQYVSSNYSAITLILPLFPILLFITSADISQSILTDGLLLSLMIGAALRNNKSNRLSHIIEPAIINLIMRHKPLNHD